MLLRVSPSADKESDNDDECSSPLGGISLSNVAVSSLGSPLQPTVSHVNTSISDLTHATYLQSPVPINASALSVFNQQLNSLAGVRDFLMTFTTDLLVTTPNSIKLQATTLSQLTQATNQLTRSSSVNIFSTALSMIFTLARYR